MNQPGILDINGVEVHYMPAAYVTKGLKYVDVFDLIPLVQRMAFKQVQGQQPIFDPPNLLFTGPKGTGKSLFCAFTAEQMRLPYFSMDCSEGTRDRQLKGGFIVSGAGHTPFVLGTVANAIQVANEVGFAMLVLEEINALSPQMQKELNAITDFRKKLEVPEIRARFELRPGAVLWVCATMNPSGPYGGTYELNEDLKSRFIELEMPYPPQAAEKRILTEMVPDMAPYGLMLDQVIRIAAESRQSATTYSLSTRDLVQNLTQVNRVGAEDSLFLLAQKFSDEDRALMIKRISDITKVGVWADLKQRVLKGAQEPPVQPPTI